MADTTMMILPPRADLCQTCATDHEPALPHNACSLHYQVAFQMLHGRAPNWTDAMEHCSDEVRAVWTETLASLGVNVAAGEVFAPRPKSRAATQRLARDVASILEADLEPDHG